MTTETSAKSSFSPELLARIEDAGINASAPREQRWVDGWLMRFSPAKAKRARCIQPVASGRLSVADKLAICLPFYAQVGLHPYIRITPFAQPSGLDDALAAEGMDRLDLTRVLACGLDALPVSTLAKHAWRFAEVGPADFAAWVGRQRGSTAVEQHAHADRIAHSPVPHRSVLAFDGSGQPIGAGQVVTEGELAGLYDVFTAESQRGRGVAEGVCRHLLRLAVTSGARIGYLQVDAANDPALRLYRRLGFVDGYSYHYRTPPEPAASTMVETG